MNYREFHRIHFDGSGVPETICRTIFGLPDGCNMKTAAALLDVDYFNLCTQVRRGRIPAIADAANPQSKRFTPLHLIQLARARYGDESVLLSDPTGSETFVRFRKEVINESRVPLGVAVYIFLRPDGDHPCVACREIGYGDSAFTNHSKDGRVKASTREGCIREKTMPQAEMVRLAQLKYGWIPVGIVARAIGVTNTTRFAEYASLGEFGPTVYNIFNELCIRAELGEPKYQEAVLAKYKKVAASHKEHPNRDADPGYYTSRMISKMVDISKGTINNWCQQGWLKSERKGNAYIFSKANLLIFIDEAIEGKYAIRPPVLKELEKLRRILTSG